MTRTIQSPDLETLSPAARAVLRLLHSLLVDGRPIVMPGRATVLAHVPELADVHEGRRMWLYDAREFYNRPDEKVRPILRRAREAAEKAVDIKPVVRNHRFRSVPLLILRAEVSPPLDIEDPSPGPIPELPTADAMERGLAEAKLRKLVEVTTDEDYLVRVTFEYRRPDGNIVHQESSGGARALFVRTVDGANKQLLPLAGCSFDFHVLTPAGMDAVEAGGGGEALPAAGAAPAGEWLSPPVPLAVLANRLGNITTKNARSILKPHGLKNAGNRQLWKVRLDGMDDRMRRQVEGRK